MQVDRKKTKWQEKREASYAGLLDAAMRRFHDHGFAAARIDDIAADAGYTSGAFYFHFQNKLDCFWAVVDYRERLRGDWVTGVTSDVDPATTTLAELLRRVFASFARVDGGVSAWVLVMVDFFQQHRGEADIHARLAEIYEGWHRNVARFVTALQAGGWIEADRDPALLATQIFAYAEGLTTHARLYRLPQETTEAALMDGLTRLLAKA